jgi:hypothetical protein
MAGPEAGPKEEPEYALLKMLIPISRSHGSLKARGNIEKTNCREKLPCPSLDRHQKY